MANRQSKLKRIVSRHPGWGPWLIFLLFALGGMAISLRLYQLETSHERAHFVDVADDRVTLLNSAIQTAVRPVEHIASLFTLLNGRLTTQDFRREARSLPLAQEVRLLAVQWIARENTDGREAFVVRYSYAPSDGAALVGVDLLAHPILGPWLRLAARSNVVTLSPWYEADGQILIRAVRPVFMQRRDGTRVLLGFSSGVYRMDRLLEYAWAGAPGTPIEDWLTQEGVPGAFYYRAGAAHYIQSPPNLAPGALSSVEKVHVPGATWRLLLVAPPGAFPHTSSFLIIGVAILLSGFLLALHLRSLQTRQQLVGKLVEQRTQSLNQRTQELETVYRSAPVGLAVLDRELHFMRVNERLANLNHIPVEAHVGKSLREVMPWISNADPDIGMRITTTGEAVHNLEFRSRMGEPSEEERFFNTHWIPLKDGAGRVWGVNVVMEETTQRRKLEEQARHLAEHDPLTGLPNRRLLIELINVAIRGARRTGRKVALLFLDLDNFKAVNDTLGHEVGDALLKAVSSRILSRVRGSDLVARLGGDEFTVLLTDLSESAKAGELADEVCRSLQHPFYFVGQTLYVTTSIGISIFPDDSKTADGLLRRADLAMYDAKERGRNTFRFYNADIDRRAREHASIAHNLHEALDKGELTLLYQPEFDLRTGRIVCVEALVRWQHPAYGQLRPDRFIPVAEESDLVIAVDEWVLRTACRQARSWLDQENCPIKVAVNLSAKGFERSDLIETVRTHLAASGLAAECLELELTESTVMRRIEQSIARMQDLVDLGVGIAVDDFGTGYSSLSYLKQLPISKLKIDRSFVRDIDRDPDDRAIVQAVTALAHTLNKRVIAEGVETNGQRDFLVSTGCDEAQGFLFNGPLPPKAISSLLH